MKKLVLTFSLLTLVILFVHGQTYHLTVSSEPYVNLAGGTSLVNESWDDPSFTVPIGFTFQFYEKNVTALVQLSELSYPILSDGSINLIQNMFFPFGADLIDRGYATGEQLSPITYKTEGTAGQRVFTIEWNNAGFYNQFFIDGVITDYVNVQMRLYESNGDIEYHYGPSSITVPETDYDDSGPFVGIIENLNLQTKEGEGEAILLTGNPSEPGIVETYSAVYLNGTIPANTVYKFSREITDIDDPSVSLNRLYYHPNPASDVIWLDEEMENRITSPIEVYNAIGGLVMKDSDPVSVDISGLENGVYFIRVKSDVGLKSQRIVVAR